MPRLTDQQIRLARSLGTGFTPTPLHPRFAEMGVTIHPVDARGNYRFSRLVIHDFGHGPVKAIVQGSGEPQPYHEGHTHFVETEWGCAFILSMTGMTVTLPDGSTDTITAVKGGGATDDLAGQVLWTIYRGTDDDKVPTRYTDGTSDKDSGHMTTIFGVPSRAGAGPQMGDFVIFFASGKVIIVSVKGSWRNRMTVATRDTKRWRAGEVHLAERAGATRVTQCGEETAAALNEGRIEILHLNIEVDADTGEVFEQAVLMGKVAKLQGGIKRISEDKGAAIYLSDTPIKSGRRPMRFNHSRVNKLPESVCSPWRQLDAGYKGLWNDLMGQALVDLRTDVPEGYGIAKGSKKLVK